MISVKYAHTSSQNCPNFGQFSIRRLGFFHLTGCICWNNWENYIRYISFIKGKPCDCLFLSRKQGLLQYLPFFCPLVCTSWSSGYRLWTRPAKTQQLSHNHTLTSTKMSEQLITTINRMQRRLAEIFFAMQQLCRHQQRWNYPHIRISVILYIVFIDIIF